MIGVALHSDCTLTRVSPSAFYHYKSCGAFAEDARPPEHALVFRLQLNLQPNL